MITSDIPEDFLIFPFVIKGKYAPNIAKKIFGLLVEKNNRPREEEIERNPEFPYDGTLSVFSDDSSYMWSDIESEDDTDYTRIDQPKNQSFETADGNTNLEPPPTYKHKVEPKANTTHAYNRN